MAKKGQVKAQNTSGKTRRVRQATRRQKRKHQKKEARAMGKLPSGIILFGQVFVTWRENFKLFTSVILIYLVLNIILASSLSSISTNFNNIKANFGSANSLADGLGSLLTLTSSSGAGNSTSGSYQSVLIVIFSLVIIWALRKISTKEKIKPKQAFYRSTDQLIPFVLVILMIILQIVPVLLVSLILATVLSTIFVGGLTATILLLLIIVPLISSTIYMVSASFFALYIVTLPDMQPRQALRSAKKLVAFRRWPILRRFLIFMIFIALLYCFVMLPLILYVEFLVVPALLVLNSLLIYLTHSYFYNLYKGLLS